MSAAIFKTNAADRSAGFLEDKLFSSNGSISQTIVDDGNGNLSMDLSASVGPYRVYTALLRDLAGIVTVDAVLANTLGGAVVWTQTGVNQFVATLANGFIQNKTFCDIILGPDFSPSSQVPQAFYLTIDTCLFIWPENVDSLLQVEIRVYDLPNVTPPPPGQLYVQTVGNTSVDPANEIIGVSSPLHVITINPATYPVGKKLLIKDESFTVESSGNPISIVGPFENGSNEVTIGVDGGCVMLYSNGVDTLYLIQL